MKHSARSRSSGGSLPSIEISKLLFLVRSGFSRLSCFDSSNSLTNTVQAQTTGITELRWYSLNWQNFVRTSHFSEVLNWHGTWYKSRVTTFLFLIIARSECNTQCLTMTSPCPTGQRRNKPASLTRLCRHSRHQLNLAPLDKGGKRRISN